MVEKTANIEKAAFDIINYHFSIRYHQ